MTDGRLLERRAAVGVVCATIVSTTVFLGFLLAPSGLETRFKDARQFFRAGLSLHDGHGLTMPELDPMTGRVEYQPLSSFPPLQSISYAVGLRVGVPVDAVPTVIALIAWPLFLAGIGVLATRLGASPTVAAATVVLSAVTWPFLHVFTRLQSESLFLPLLVWTMIAFHGMPTIETRARLRLGGALLLLCLLLLSRYTGMFVFLPIVAWWIATRIRQRRHRQLVPELAVFGLAAFPFLLWLIRNRRLTGGIFGPTLMSGTLDRGAAHVIGSFLTQATWLPLPSLRPGPLWLNAPTWALAYAVIVALGLALLWWAHHRARRVGAPVSRPSWPESPLVPFVVFYLGFLLAAPLFMRMQGMIERYMAVVLCLSLPWLAAFVSRRAGRPGARWLTLVAAANLVLVLGVTLTAAPASEWWRDGAPIDFADRTDEADRRLHAGAPAWLVHRPPRVGDLARHMPGLTEILEGEGQLRAVISNAPDLFNRWPLLASENAVELWLELGRCNSEHPAAVIVVDWDRWRKGVTPGKIDPAELRQRVARHCPHLVAQSTPRATVWLLPGTVQ